MFLVKGSTGKHDGHFRSRQAWTNIIYNMMDLYCNAPKDSQRGSTELELADGVGTGRMMCF